MINCILLLQDEPEASTPVCWENASRAKIAASQADRELSQVHFCITFAPLSLLHNFHFCVTSTFTFASLSLLYNFHFHFHDCITFTFTFALVSQADRELSQVIIMIMVVEKMMMTLMMVMMIGRKKLIISFPSSSAFDYCVSLWHHLHFCITFTCV